MTDEVKEPEVVETIVTDNPAEHQVANADEEKPDVKIVHEDPPLVMVDEVETPPKPRFRVTHGDFSQEVEADNEVDAKAIFNDRRKVWPNPREVDVVQM